MTKELNGTISLRTPPSPVPEKTITLHSTENEASLTITDASGNYTIRAQGENVIYEGKSGSIVEGLEIPISLTIHYPALADQIKSETKQAFDKHGNPLPEKAESLTALAAFVQTSAREKEEVSLLPHSDQFVVKDPSVTGGRDLFRIDEDQNRTHVQMDYSDPHAYEKKRYTNALTVNGSELFAESHRSGTSGDELSGGNVTSPAIASALRTLQAQIHADHRETESEIQGLAKADHAVFDAVLKHHGNPAFTLDEEKGLLKIIHDATDEISPPPATPKMPVSNSKGGR